MTWRVLQSKLVTLLSLLILCLLSHYRVLHHHYPNRSHRSQFQMLKWQVINQLNISFVASVVSVEQFHRNHNLMISTRTLDASLLPNFECSMNIWDDNKYNNCNIEENVDVNYVINLAVTLIH